MKISEKGKIVIHAAFRKKWNLDGGSTIILTDDADGVHIRPLVRLSDLSGIDEEKGLLPKLQEMEKD